MRIDPPRLPVPEGGEGEYTVVLATRPAANVTISVAVPEGASIMADPSSLTFTPANWNTPQAVTVTEPEDDDALDETYNMIHRVTSSGSDYSNALIEVNVIEVEDNDAAPEPGVRIEPPRLTLREGETRRYTVVLTAAPAANVTVSMTVSLEADFSADPSSLTFTPQNWDTPQRVTVTASGRRRYRGRHLQHRPQRLEHRPELLKRLRRLDFGDRRRQRRRAGNNQPESDLGPGRDLRNDNRDQLRAGWKRDL